MRSLLIGVLVVVALFACIPLDLLAKGTIDSSSLRMIMNVMTGMGGKTTDAATVRQRYQLPPGFKLQLYASDLPRARFLRFTPGGDLLVSRPHSGDVILLRQDTDGASWQFFCCLGKMAMQAPINKYPLPGHGPGVRQWLKT